MPILKNPRHEAFARAIVQGRSQIDAYDLAGYTNNYRESGQPSTLFNNPVMQERIRELQKELEIHAIATAAEVTRDTLIADLIKAKNLAFSQNRADAVGNLVQKIAILKGVWVEKVDQTTRNDVDDMSTQEAQKLLDYAKGDESLRKLHN